MRVHKGIQNSSLFRGRTTKRIPDPQSQLSPSAHTGPQTGGQKIRTVIPTQRGPSVPTCPGVNAGIGIRSEFLEYNIMYLYQYWYGAPVLSRGGSYP